MKSLFRVSVLALTLLAFCSVGTLADLSDDVLNISDAGISQNSNISDKYKITFTEARVSSFKTTQGDPLNTLDTGSWFYLMSYDVRNNTRDGYKVEFKPTNGHLKPVDSSGTALDLSGNNDGEDNADYVLATTIHEINSGSPASIQDTQDDRSGVVGHGVSMGGAQLSNAGPADDALINGDGGGVGAFSFTVSEIGTSAGSGDGLVLMSGSSVHSRTDARIKIHLKVDSTAEDQLEMAGIYTETFTIKYTDL
jgi:hypothetical protein